jgi:serine O-acetyltransferase
MQPGDSARGLTFSQLVFSDVARLRPGVRASWPSVLLRVPSVPGVLASIILRAQQCLHRSGRTRLAGSLQTLGASLIGAEFGAGMQVGTGFAIVHPVGVTMGYGARVGDNVTFASGVVLAARYYDHEHGQEQEFPVIEDGATIGAHAVLVGGVRVGRNAMVGANSVVLNDVPDNTVVLGAPARRVGIREETQSGGEAAGP